jgi:integrase/recombinase XerD
VIEIPLVTPIFESYATNLERQHRASTTVYRNRHTLSRLEEWAASEGLDPLTLTPQHMNDYLNQALKDGDANHPPLSSVTRRGHLICLRSAYQWALDVDLAAGKNPCRRIQVKVRRPQQRFLSAAQLRTTLAACVTPDEYLAVLTLTLTGLRLFELCALRWERAMGRDRRGDEIALPWADLQCRVLHVVGKDETPRQVPIHPALQPILAAAHERRSGPYVIGNRSGGPLWTSGMLRAIDKPLRRAGVKEPGLGGHAFRRAFNNTLRRNARGYEYERRLILGHSTDHDINESRYSSATINDLADVVSRAYLDDPILPSMHQ